MQTARERTMNKTSDSLRECNNHVLNMVKRLSGLAITATLIFDSPPPAHTLYLGAVFP